MDKDKSIEVTPAMEMAGIKALRESGVLENGIFKPRIFSSVVRDVIMAMIEAKAASDPKMHSDHATEL